MARSAWLALLFVALGSGDGWRRIEPPLALSWPRDHGAHFDTRTEWWYATGELAAQDGARFSFQLTLFRQGLDPGPLPAGASALRAQQAFAGHFVLIDLASGKLLRAERLRRRTTGLADAATDGLDLRLESWTMRAQAARTLALHADDRERGLALDLELESGKELVLHGAGGLSRKGDEPGNASVYASWTRLAARGALTFEGRHFDVRGEAWFDHEWGSTQLGAEVAGWDWFGLRLDDGRELMLYRLRRADGSALSCSSATLVAQAGSARALPLDRFTLEETTHWQSPTSGARYPARWRLRLPEEGLDLELVPRVPDCEVDGRLSTGVIYWEGPLEVRGSVRGSGYGELTGYAGSIARRF
jgi:predicted secreted hydrolase